MGSEQHKDIVDCREALHRIYHFLDGELTATRRGEIEEHLNGCSPCLHLFGFEAEIRKLVADKCRDAVPDGLRARIADAIDHEHEAETADARDGPSPGTEVPGGVTA